MSLSLDQILPSLQALGVLGYWLIGLASALEAFFLTGIVVPGTLIVDAGGILVQRGLLDFFDLAWFVAIGSILGSEASYWTGRLAMHRLPGRKRIEGSAAFARAVALFEKRGGFALVIGRFFGPLAGFVSLAAGMAGMERRRFLCWNVIGSVPYALGHVAVGFFLGDVLGRIGGSLTRVALLVGVAMLLLLVLWSMLYSALRLTPLAFAILSAALRGLKAHPAVTPRLERHPRIVGWIEARFDRSDFIGLPLTLLAVVFLYVGTIWLDSVVDFVSGDPMLQLDARLAELMHHFQSPLPVRIASFVTAIGGWHVVTPLIAATLVWLMLEARRPLAAGLLVTVAGNTATVAVLKLIFARPRSPLGYFAETSGSFPSGHAAASVAVYGMLLFVFWRARKLRAETALLTAGVVALAIGGSRIFLVEHYLSDVLNGWLVGAMWLTIGIAISEWVATRRNADWARITGKWRYAGIAAVVLLIAFGAANVWRYDHPRNPPVSTADVVLPDPRAILEAPGFEVTTESLLGSPVAPVSLIVLAPDGVRLTEVMHAAGWAEASRPVARLVADALRAAVAGREDPTAETMVHFWRGAPNDLVYHQASASGTAVRSDPKVRFWQSEYVTSDGARAYIGTVGSEDAGESAATRGGHGELMSTETVVQALSSTGVEDIGQISLARSNVGSGSSRTIALLRLQ